MQDWSKDMETELEIRGIRINDDLYLNGKLDMVVPLENNKCDVIDFKTGKPKSRNVIEGNVKDGDGNYKRQLIFYKILLDRFRNGFYKMNRGIIEFVEPNDAGVYKRESFDITKDETDELLKLIEKSASEIIALSFWNEACPKKECEYCRLRKYIN
jgi:CRISPR/Cas system-associated exonuclease Cas4 (RecB family)